VKGLKSIGSAALLFLALSGAAGAAAPPKDWTAPLAPFHIAGNIYYVGSEGLASYLIVTPAGNILINPSLESSPPLIRASIERLGFKYADTKILLISHAHNDHDAGGAAVIEATHAKYFVMDGDAPVVESGGKTDFAYPDSLYPPARVDRVLHDGDKIELGGTVIVAHKTAGHTRGCTTYTLRTREAGAWRDVVIVGSWNVNPGFRLLDKPGRPASYPGIAADYEHTFALLKSLPCEVFLGAHGYYFDMRKKLLRARRGGHSVWIDPAGYRAAVAEREQAFQAELKRQEAEG
jgi:metallo-beta-lactamase class B